MRATACSLCLCLAAAAGCQRQSPPPAAPAVAPAPASAAPATRPERSEPRILELSGVARAARTSPLSAKAGGILRSIKVREGQRVKAGELLCQLDPTDILLRQQAAELSLAQANEALQNARNDLERAEQLHQARAVTRTALEKAQLQVRIAALQAQAAEVGLRMARQALADTGIRAPFSGIITKVLAEEGQMITTMPPVTIFSLVDTDTLEVRVPVPERRLARVRRDQPVRVIFPSFGAEREGKIDRITEVIDPATRAAEAIIRIDNKDGALPAGLFARVRFPGVSDEDEFEPGADTGPQARADLSAGR